MFMSAPFLTQKPSRICKVRVGRMSVALSVIAVVVCVGFLLHHHNSQSFQYLEKGSVNTKGLGRQRRVSVNQRDFS